MRLFACAAAVAVVVASGSAGGAATPPGLATAEAMWSPDGRTIAFTGRSAATGRTDVYTIGVDGSRLLDLTGDDARSNLYDPTLPAAHGEPAWSRQGRIAYVTALGAYTAPYFEYSVMNADGTSKRQVTWERTAQRPSWSPDGTR